MTLNEQQREQIEKAIFAGRKIEAIKLHREATGSQLVDAKRAVEDMEADLRRRNPELFISKKSGCAGVLACTVLTVTLAGVYYIRLFAEDLTTLDGKTFLNITNVTKYQNLIVIGYNGTRTGIANTNLPTTFREKYDIKLSTNISISGTSQTLTVTRSPTDSFLWKNRQTDLYQLEFAEFYTNKPVIPESKRWSIYLKGVDVSLSAETTFHYASLPSSSRSYEMEFEIGQEELVSKIFDKFLEWSSIATTNHAENFEKQLGKRPANQSYLFKESFDGQCEYTFIWSNNESELQVSGATLSYGHFDPRDVVQFQEFLKLLPSMKEKLVAAIRAKESQKDLFK